MSRHRFDPFSFLFGAAFIIVALGSLSGTHVGGFHNEEAMSFSVVILGGILVVWAIVAIGRKRPAPIIGVPDGTPSDEPTGPEAEDEAPSEPERPEELDTRA